ncbi:hydrolase [endosymbiont of unidentified scaly snail isolate Monju]|uniref:hydrolase n=1 Tax=endosymbiont of unidentified scaly snail isolate Monju TaxID=1248727 RepID=UPI001E474826|nr:hydrolase [endosymbiont of unidentified scaly snail isolate Monju]
MPDSTGARNMPRVQSEFRPAWWLRGAHAQTLWPTLFRRGPRIALEWERVSLPDGDFIDLCWHGPRDGPMVLFLHGLEGSIHSHYARGILRELGRRGFRACLMHFRGCSGEPNWLPIAYHSGKTDDPLWLIHHLHERGEVFGAVGVSLGGNVLLKLLGELGEAVPLRRAAVMSVPFVLDHAARRLRQGLSRLYERHLIGHLQRSFERKFARLSCPLSVEVRRLRSFHAFDDQVTAPLHGFAGVDDYYQQASSRQFIPKIRIPTLILHALDDPFMFPHTAPDAEELPECVRLEIAPRGGHMGFVTGRWPWRADYWGERRLASWIAGEVHPP